MAGGFFILSVEGKGFDAEEYLKTVQFKAYREGSGFVVELGDENELSLPKQIEAASTFLLEHLDDIKRLQEWPGYEGAVLHLSPEVSMSAAVGCFGLYFPAELVLLAAHAGVAMGFAVRPKHKTLEEFAEDTGLASLEQHLSDMEAEEFSGSATATDRGEPSAKDGRRGNARTTIRLESDWKLANLLYALRAMTDSWRHEANQFEVVNDEGMAIAVNTATGFVSYGKSSQPIESRKWDDNVGHQRIVRFSMLLQRGFYKEIEEYNWHDPSADAESDKPGKSDAAKPDGGEARETE